MQCINDPPDLPVMSSLNEGKSSVPLDGSHTMSHNAASKFKED